MEENEIERTEQSVQEPAAAPGTENTPAAPDPAELEALRQDLAGLRREWEDFLAGTAVRPDATPSPGGSDPAPVCTAERLRGMTAAEINARWNEIRRGLAGGRM